METRTKSNHMETKDIIKQVTSFRPVAFKMRPRMTAPDYYAYLSRKAVQGELLTQEEVDHFTSQFKHLHVPQENTVVNLENLIKLRLRKKIDQFYYDHKNKNDSADHFVEDIIKHKK